MGVSLPGGDGIDVMALIDSGSDSNFFAADVIGIERLESGRRSLFQGIEGKGVEAFAHDVNLSVGGIEVKTHVFFSRDVVPETLLLGMDGFFSLSVVTFDYAKRAIEIKTRRRS